MKKILRSDNFRLLIFVFIMVGFIGSISVFAYKTKDVQELFPTAGEAINLDMDEGWIDEDGNTVDLTELSFDDLDSKGSYLFHRTIPDGLIGEESFCMQLNNMSYAIYCDDKQYIDIDGDGDIDSKDLGFQIETEKSEDDFVGFDKTVVEHYKKYKEEYGLDYIVETFCGEGSGIGARGAGSSIHTVQLYYDDSGDTIYLELFPVYVSASVSNVRITPANYYIRMRILSAFPAFIISIILIIGGGAVLIMTHYLTEKLSQKTYASLAVLVILAGFWSLIESHMFDFVTGTSDYLHAVNYVLLMLMPYPAALFSEAITIRPHKNLSGIIFNLSIIVIAVTSVCNYSGFADYHVMTPLIDIMILITLVIVIGRIILDMSFRKENDIHVSNGWIEAGLMCLTIGALIDTFRYVGVIPLSTGDDNAFITRIGLVAFVLGILLNIYKDVLRSSEQANQAGVYMEMAYSDPMTGLPNRAAFFSKENELSQFMMHGPWNKDSLNREVLFASFDLNGLKKVNDTLGHAMGDEYIIASGTVLMQAFAGAGDVFRTGGDEFSVFISTVDAVDKYNNAIDIMLQMEDNYNQNTDYPVRMQFAYGYSVWKHGDSRSIAQLERDGDNAMYETKREMKEQNNREQVAKEERG